MKVGRRAMDKEICPMSVQDMIDLHSKLAMIENDLAAMGPLVKELHEKSLRADAGSKAGYPLKIALGFSLVMLIGSHWAAAQPLLMKIVGWML